MLKQLSICAALVTLGTGPIDAQQQQTDQPNRLSRENLTKIEVPGADFDIVFATTESKAVVVIDNGHQIDPLDAGLWPTRVYRVPKGDTLASPNR